MELKEIYPYTWILTTIKTFFLTNTSNKLKQTYKSIINGLPKIKYTYRYIYTFNFLMIFKKKNKKLNRKIYRNQVYMLHRKLL